MEKQILRPIEEHDIPSKLREEIEKNKKDEVAKVNNNKNK